MAHPHDAHRQALAALLPDLRAFARMLARDPAAADDLVQETLMRALAALPQFTPGTSLKAWSFSILRNVFYAQYRRRRVERRYIEQAPPAEEASPAGQDAAIALGDLAHAIWRLPPLLREALILVGAQDMSYESAAAICGVPVGTMKARVSRARNALSRHVAGATVD